MSCTIFRTTFLFTLLIFSFGPGIQTVWAASTPDEATVEAKHISTLQEVKLKLEQLSALINARQTLVSLQTSSPLVAHTSTDSKFVLGAATHFSHGQDMALLDTVKGLGANTIRDGIGWSDVERQKGVYTFTSKSVSYLDTVTKPGTESFIVFQPLGNKLYNNGDTVVTAVDITAFGKFVVAILDKYPDIERIEIGNEFNSTNEYFNRGEATGENPRERAQYYTNIIKGVYPIIKAKHPDVEVLGGATHSLPVGYIQFLKEFGALEYMDGIAFHPYRPEPEQVDAEVRYLREVINDPSLSLYATEFGTDVPLDETPNYMLKMVVLMADAGVDEAIWYQLKGLKNTALIDTKGVKRPASESFTFINKTLLPAGRPKKLSADKPLQVFSLGTNFHVIWGNAKAIQFTGNNLEFYNARGVKISQPKSITDMPVVIKGTNFAYTTSGESVIADSFYQFDLKNSKTGYWSYYGLSSAGTLEPLTVSPGQHKKGVTWNPSLSNKSGYPFIVNDDSLRPANSSKVVERFTAKQTATVNIVGTWTVQANSVDGIGLEIKKNGTRLYQADITGSKEVTLSDVALLPGDTIDFIVDNKTNTSNDSTVRSIEIISKKTTPVVEPPPPPPTSTSTPPTKGLTGTAGNDVLTGTAGPDIINGKGGDDNLKGEAGNDRLQGNGGDDMLFGGDGADDVSGGGGVDVLTGGAGIDTLQGGTGADVFQLSTETTATAIDTITDFSLEQGDTINISSALTASQQSLPLASVMKLKKKGGVIEVSIKSGDSKSAFTKNVLITITPELTTVPLTQLLPLFVVKSQ